ncbi:MULE domain-containing protein [Trichonephila clavipes]|nr:MULE domain-containing protein [Trichonephila clavipes]
MPNHVGISGIEREDQKVKQGDESFQPKVLLTLRREKTFSSQHSISHSYVSYHKRYQEVAYLNPSLPRPRRLPDHPILHIQRERPSFGKYVVDQIQLRRVDSSPLLALLCKENSPNALMSECSVTGKLKERVLVKIFLKDIREEITVDSGRKMLNEKKDIHNIKRDFNINGYVKRHEIDAVSVKLWAQEMKNNGENCIVYFKEQGQSGNDYCLKDEDFVLVILTDFQKEMIKKYGKDKICIDGTHGLNTHTAMISIYTQFL